ncbi:hypothetical protein CCR80_03460 [Rhodothalassium salexigens]|uniref:VPS10 domain-containing protein n=1 Tax=Rhodothalassium salexigens TaxID=1086 RepID=UPI00191191EF|nr:hypothetical protein [Rhodothalassium salexigens]MBK5920097.1 hypothetical protein [Rhodothalassium salexigens]
MSVARHTLRSRLTGCAMAAALALTAPGVLTAPAAAADDAYAVDPAQLDALEYRNIGPWRGGRVTAVAGHPDQPATFYMGAVGGLFKTTNAGQSWQPVGDDQLNFASVGALAVAPSNPHVVVAGLGESPYRGVASSYGDGVYRTVDGGRTWTHLGLEDARQISAIGIDPADEDRFLVAVQGDPWAETETRGVYRTEDGGQTFERVLYVDETTSAIDLQINPANPRIVYAALWDNHREAWEVRSGGPGSGLYKSTDFGRTWERMTDGLPEVMGKAGIAPSPAQDGRVWAIVEAEGDEGGLYRSDDGGESWSHINGNRRLHARSWYYMHITADPQNPDTVYVQNSSFQKSIDGGRTFQRIVGRHGDHHALWINPDNPRIMIDGNDGGAEVSFDGGQSWSSIMNQPTAQFYRVNADNAFAYKVYGGQQDNSTVAIRSRGHDGRIGREDFHSVGGCESAHVAFDPDNPRYVYAGCYLGQISEYDSQTRTTRDIRAYPETAFGVPPKDRRYRFNWNAPILVSAHDPQTLYHGGNMVLKSTDRGHSWTEISPDLTKDQEDRQGPGGRPITNEVSENYNTLLSLAEDPRDPAVLWAGSDDGKLHVTRDGGDTWDNVTPPRLGDAMVNAIHVSAHDSDRVYVAAMGYKQGDYEPRLYRTENGGRGWQRIDQGLPEGVVSRVVREDTERAGLLFAGLETGVFISFNDGRDWQPFDTNMPPVPITDLKVHKGDLVVATQGRAFWVLDDITPLRQMTDDTRAAAAHLYRPRPAYRLLTEGTADEEPGANPPSGAVLTFSLADDPDAEKPKDGADDTAEAETETTGPRIDILDADGRIVRRLDAQALKAERGLNRVTWDLRAEALKPVDDLWFVGGGDDGRFAGYPVPPGRYTVRLTLGDTVSEQPLDVAIDPRVAIADDQLAAWAEMTRAAHDRVADFHGSVVGLRALREQAQDKVARLEERDADADLIAAGQAVVDAVDDWMAGRINPERSFFQDVLNWPDKLHSDLLFQALTVSDAIQGPTAGMAERQADLADRFAAAITARDAIVDGPVKAFNDAVAEARTPAVLVPDFTGTADLDTAR